MLISIITINYNDCDGLEKTIKSVIHQSYRDFEHLIIDGGSNDGSKEIILQYQSNFSYWVSEKDRGIYHAMNKGIRAATGKYLLFLNSGDFLYNENVFINIAKHLKDCDILYGDLINVNGKEEYISKGSKPDTLTVYSFFKGSVNHPASFIKKDLFYKYGLYDESLKIVSDWKFFMQVIGIEGVRVKYIEQIITYFNLNGISSSNFKLSKLEREQVIKEIIPKAYIEDYLKYDELNNVLKLRLVRYALIIQNMTWFRLVKKSFSKIAKIITN